MTSLPWISRLKTFPLWYDSKMQLSKEMEKLAKVSSKTFHFCKLIKVNITKGEVAWITTFSLLRIPYSPVKYSTCRRLRSDAALWYLQCQTLYKCSYIWFSMLQKINDFKWRKLFQESWKGLWPMLWLFTSCLLCLHVKFFFVSKQTISVQTL